MRRFVVSRWPDVQIWSGDGDGFVFGTGTVYGLDLAPVNPELGSYFGADSGVLVLDAHEESLGLEPGDVILRIGDRDVESPRDVRRILRSYDGDEEISFEIRRGGATQTVTGTIG